MIGKYFDVYMEYCHQKGYKSKKILDYLSKKGVTVNEETAISGFTDYLNRKYLK